MKKPFSSLIVLAVRPNKGLKVRTKQAMDLELRSELIH
ncbi:hypothetical protein C900_04477 [Fulvivirga imtechensis AK7]|uniref:Uncharacterized protein n=1 Tax=Fulvivirga imtechensis AK7 TaxID=1237149 RepID=L8JR29_9BACT|nr:hypothetical protein C900_04477 [Fulvivirga imtechensis AK7]